MIGMIPNRESQALTVMTSDIRETFGRRGLRWTRQREQIFAALAATQSHPTAEELHLTVHDDCPAMSLATVYNTLEVFTRLGLCRRISNGGGSCRYDMETTDHVHVTLEDGRILDLPSDLSHRLMECLPDSVLKEVEERMGVRLSRVSVDLGAQAAAD